jgi:hypothetical protein
VFAAIAGLATGLVHVLSGPDHLAAVAPLSAGRERQQWRAGLQWGLGHTTGVMTIGLLLIVFRQLVPIDGIASFSERIVGIALLIVGAWGFVRARNPQPHVHPAATASFAMGALHGLAGSSHLFGVLPALALPTPTDAFAYLTGFGVGAVVAMTVFSAFVGAVAAIAARRGVNAYRGLLYACSLSAVVVGGFWLIT